MRKTSLFLPEELYQKLRKEGYEKEKAMAHIIVEALEKRYAEKGGKDV